MLQLNTTLETVRETLLYAAEELQRIAKVVDTEDTRPTTALSEHDYMLIRIAAIPRMQEAYEEALVHYMVTGEARQLRKVADSAL